MDGDNFVINTFSYIWQFRVDECIAHLVARGHTQFEILLTAPHLWPSESDGAARARLMQQVRALEARIVSLNAGGFDNNLVSPAEDVRRFARRYLCNCVDLAADLDSRYVVVSPGIGRPLHPPPTPWLLDWLRAGLTELVLHADKRGVQVLLENIPFSFLPRADGLMAAIEEFPANRIGVVYDVANAVFAREDPVEGLTRVAPRLRLVHLSDTPLERWEHATVGHGVVPFDRVRAALAKLRYEGPQVLELVTQTPDGDIEASIAALRTLGW
jgi:sugar phosphate isomerase/epimerase